MLSFVIPFKSFEASNCWTEVCLLLEQTLESICKQTSQNYKVIVVCTQIPEIQFYSPLVKYVQIAVDPAITNSLESRRRDKLKKIQVGCNLSRAFDCDYIMVVDSDDLISDRIAEFVDDQIDQDGWIFDTGYVHEKVTEEFYTIKSGFYYHCGTCLILKPHLMEMLFDYENGWFDHELNAFRRQNIILPHLPFNGAIYRSTNGQNNYSVIPVYNRFTFYGENFARLISQETLSIDIKSEFCFPPKLTDGY